MAGLRFKNGKVEDLTIVLSTRDYQHLGQLTGVKNVHYAVSENAPNELSFTLTKHDLLKVNGNTTDNIKRYLKIKTAIWEQLVDFKLVWVKETNEYFQIAVSTTDSFEVSKTVTGTPIPEAELSQILLTAEINTESDIQRKSYEVTTFYNESNPNASLLHRVLSRAPGYTIGYVDDSLKKKQRVFSISNSTIYDFLTGECATQFNCMFQFDSADRSISVYDLDTYGTDTTIYVDKNNLTDSINLSVNTDSVKNCFKLVAGDDRMTAAVRMLNPTGSDYIYHIPEYLRKDMPDVLVKKLDEYEVLSAGYTNECETLAADIYKLYDEIAYLTSGMMPTAEQAEVTATTEAEKLIQANLSPLSLESVSPSTSLETIHAALLNLARVYVRTGYVKLEIDNETEAYKPAIDMDTFINDENVEEVTKDEDGFHSFKWKGRIKVTNYSNKEDVVYSKYLEITVNDSIHANISQKVLKTATQDDDTGLVLNVLKLESLEEFKTALKEYSFNRLVSFYDAIKAALDTLESMEQADEAADLYETLYVPYQDKRKAMGIVCKECGRFIEDSYDMIPECPDCHSKKLTYGELVIRHSQIQEKQTQLDERLERREEIQEALDMETYLGAYYPLFSSYRREDVYENSNYISDGLSNEEIVERARAFTEVAKEELYKSCEQQISITSTLFNLLLMPEFAPLLYPAELDNTQSCMFDTGSWLRIGIDGVLYKLRLQHYSVDFDSASTLNVEFSNAVLGHQASNELKSVMASAKSMATSYSYVAKQVDKGKMADEQIQDWLQNGLNSAHVMIKNNDNEEVIYTKHGILCRSYDDISGTYEKEQVKLTHNNIVYTDDNWQSVKMALGKHKYRYYDVEKNDFFESVGYGLSADFMTANSVVASPQIIGGQIYSSRYSKTKNKGSYIDLENGTFNLGGGKLVLDDDALTLLNGTITGGSLYIGNTDTGTFAKITEDGILNCNGANLSGTFSHYDTDMGMRSIEVSGNSVKFFSWKDSGDIVGKIGSIENLENGNMAFAIASEPDNVFVLGYTDDSGTYPVISFDPNDMQNGLTPYIKNTANGTIFNDNPNGGITVEHGLITGWSLKAANGTLFSDNPNGGITVKDGLITGWSMQGYDGTISFISGLS